MRWKLEDEIDAKRVRMDGSRSGQDIDGWCRNDGRYAACAVKA